jgi:uncharacterized protein (DUF1015 family)
VAGVGGQPPLVTATTPDGTTHRVWALTDADQLAAIAADLFARRAIIADGHHRYATYLRYQEQRHEAGDGAGPWDFGLTLLVDASAFGPEVHPIHRVIPGLRPEDAVRRAEVHFAVRQLDGPVDEGLSALAAAGKGGPAFLVSGGSSEGPAWLLSDPGDDLLARLPTDRSAAWRGLDVTVAHYGLIRAVWGLPDTEQAVGYEHDVAAALGAAAASQGTALLLNPTPVADVAAVAAAGERMPRKSTLFTPKPATGLLLRALDLG